jgi:hypothetical protein
MDGMCDRGLLPSAARFILLTSAIHIAPCILEENTPISSSKITDVLNTLKLATFSLYVIYVLRLINIFKYEIIFRDQKLAEMFWLHFYREAMPPHPCTLHPWSYMWL